MNLLEQIKNTAKKCNKRIVLPEGEEERTLKAANILVEEGIARIILLGSPQSILNKARDFKLQNIEGASIIDPKNHAKKDTYIERMETINELAELAFASRLKRLSERLMKDVSCLYHKLEVDFEARNKIYQ